MHEARKHERTAVKLWPRHRVATEVDYREAACLDLSAGGMFIESPTPAEPGTFVKVECRGDCGTFRALGNVAWRRPAEAETPGGMGIQFVRLSRNGSNVIDGLLASARLSAVARASVADDRTTRTSILAASFLTLLGMFWLWLNR